MVGPRLFRSRRARFVAVLLGAAALAVASWLVVGALRGPRDPDDGVYRAGILYFYLPGCPTCDEFLAFLDALEERYPVRFRLLSYDLLEKENYQEAMRQLGHTGRKIDAVPLVFYGSRVFQGEEYLTDLEPYLLESMGGATGEDPPGD